MPHFADDDRFHACVMCMLWRMLMTAATTVAADLGQTEAPALRLDYIISSEVVIFAIFSGSLVAVRISVSRATEVKNQQQWPEQKLKVELLHSYCRKWPPPMTVSATAANFAFCAQTSMLYYMFIYHLEISIQLYIHIHIYGILTHASARIQLKKIIKHLLLLDTDSHTHTHTHMQ